MEENLLITDRIIVPGDELEITASRSGGAGGQHVNKTSTRITVRWNIQKTDALTEEQKVHVLEKLRTVVTTDGDLIIHNSESRSQHHNKKRALAKLTDTLRKALYIPKKRMKTRVSQAAVEKRLHKKAVRSTIKKMRSSKIVED